MKVNNQTEIATSKPIGSLKFLLDEQRKMKKKNNQNKRKTTTEKKTYKIMGIYVINHFF